MVWNALIPLAMDVLQSGKKKRDAANQNEARAYMGDAPLETPQTDLGGSLQGLLGGIGGGDKKKKPASMPGDKIAGTPLIDPYGGYTDDNEPL